MELLNKKGTGLQNTETDLYDFSLGAITGFADVKTLPREFSIDLEGSGVRDQGDTDMCTAYALTAVAQDQELVSLDPAFIFWATKQITGEPDAWGADLRSACKAAVKYGFLERKDSGFVDPPTSGDRDRAAAGAYLKKGDLERALEHKKRSFFSVKGPYDMYDNIRSAIWQTRDENRSVFTGVQWKPEWTKVKGGSISDLGGTTSFGHAIKAIGWDNDRMILRLSNGKNIGDGGYFNITREIVNKTFTFDGFTFLDMPREQAEYEIKKKEAAFFESIGLGINYWFKSIFS